MRARAVEVLAWWLPLVGVWLLTLSSVSVSETSFAAGSALVCAVLATVARRAVGGHWRPDPRWARWLPSLAVAIVADTVRVLAVAVRHARSRQLPGRVTYASLPDPSASRRAAHQALATLTVSATPGSFVIDVDPAAHRLTTHAVTAGRPDLVEKLTNEQATP